jgi:hypothetical protein
VGQKIDFLPLSITYSPLRRSYFTVLSPTMPPSHCEQKDSDWSALFRLDPLIAAVALAQHYSLYEKEVGAFTSHLKHIGTISARLFHAVFNAPKDEVIAAVAAAVAADADPMPFHALPEGKNYPADLLQVLRGHSYDIPLVFMVHHMLPRALLDEACEYIRKYYRRIDDDGQVFVMTPAGPQCVDNVFKFEYSFVLTECLEMNCQAIDDVIFKDPSGDMRLVYMARTYFASCLPKPRGRKPRHAVVRATGRKRRKRRKLHLTRR